MNKSHNTHIHIRYVAGQFGGWTVSCPVCPSVAVRDTWPLAMAQADKHQGLHRDVRLALQRGPFAVREVTS